LGKVVSGPDESTQYEPEGTNSAGLRNRIIMRHLPEPWKWPLCTAVALVLLLAVVFVVPGSWWSLVFPKLSDSLC